MTEFPEPGSRGRFGISFEALEEVTGASRASERGALNRALFEIREQSPDLEDDELALVIRHRAQLYREVMEGLTLTPTALAKHWERVVAEHDARQDTQRQRLAEMARLQRESAENFERMHTEGVLQAVAEERGVAIKRAEAYVQNAGYHYDLWSELEAELFGPLEPDSTQAKGMLHAWSHEADLRARLEELWRLNRPRGVRADEQQQRDAERRRLQRATAATAASLRQQEAERRSEEELQPIIDAGTPPPEP